LEEIIMALRTALSVLVLTCSSLVAGCSAGTAENGSSPSTSSAVTLNGSVGGGPISEASFVGFGHTTVRSDLHVVAHELHARGETGRTVDVVVAADGSFHVDVTRGRRWLVTVDDASGASAIVTFANGQNVLQVSAEGDAARIDVGGLELVGGEAESEVTWDAHVGVEVALASADDVFEAANGAVIAARDAANEARKAADEARKAGAAAQAAADQARQAAEEAQKAAGL
jgi:hypothetical protein